MRGKKEVKSKDEASVQDAVHVKEKLSEELVQDTLQKKSRKKAVIAGSVCLVLVLAVFGAYAGGIVYYQSHFFPNTSINGMDCGNMDASEVVTMLDSQINDYVLEVTGRDCGTGEAGAILGKIQPADIHLTFDGTSKAVEAFLDSQEPFYWVSAYFGKGNAYFMEQEITYDPEMLKSTITAWDACKKENMLKPQDAYISGYSETAHCYEIMPETDGAELDVDKLVQLAGGAVSRRERTLDVEGQECYVEAAVKQDDKSLTDVVDTINSWLSTKITYDWNGTEVILDYETLKDWVSIEEGKPVLDEEQVAEFVKAQAKQYDTYGKKRTFTTTLGVELTLPSGYYGWKTDRESEKGELIELIYQGAVADREPVYSDTAMQKGMDDIGDSYVEVDITHQHVYLYKEGELVLETDCVTGNTSLDRATPEGVFCIAYRQKNAVLRGRDYETPVTYWMPFYGNYGMHDAYWRKAFGGNIYKTNGSRGCVNLPPAIAEEMFDNVRKGFPVICYYYKEDPLLNQNTDREVNTGNASVPASSSNGNSQTPGTEGQGADQAGDMPADAASSADPGTGSDTGAGAENPGTDPAAGAGAENPGAGSDVGDGAEAPGADQEADGQEPGMNDPVDPIHGTESSAGTIPENPDAGIPDETTTESSSEVPQENSEADAVPGL